MLLPDPSSRCQFTEPVSGVSVGDARFEPGRIIAGRYLVERELGRGGMGIVYLVRDQKLHGKEVALKLISAELTSSHQGQERFVQEVLAAQELQHANIVRVFHLDDVEGQSFFTMEYVSGRSLREILEERKRAGQTFSLKESEAVLLPVLRALHHAHTQSPPVIHRDIKPENIVVTGDLSEPQVKVLDFGLAKMLAPSKLTTTAMTMGTAYYMAPEQVQGAKDIDQRADLFSAGVILYEMLTGYVPSGRFKLPAELKPGLPAGIDELIDRVLQQHPVDRPASANDFAICLAGLVKEAEEDAPRKAEGDARSKAEEKVRRKVGEDAGLKVETKARREADEKAEPEPQPDFPLNTETSSGRRRLVWAALLALLAVAAFFVMNGANTFISLPQPVADAANQTSAVSRKFSLIIRTEPADARVTFVGSGLTYHEGMEVAADTYEVEVSRDGYVPRRFSFRVADRDYLSDIVALNKEPSLPSSDESSVRASVEQPVPAEPEAHDAVTAGVLPAEQALSPESEVLEAVTADTLPAEQALSPEPEVHDAVTEDALPAEQALSSVPEAQEAVTVNIPSAASPLLAESGAQDSVAEDVPPVVPPLKKTTGSLIITSSPEKARVKLDGKDVGETPLNLAEVKPGTRQIEISLKDYHPRQIQAKVSVGSAATAHVNLELVSGNLKVQSVPAGATVAVDGKTLPGVTPLTVPNLQPGSHRVALSLSDHADSAVNVKVTSGDNSLRLTLKALPKPRLRLDLTPPDATVRFTDGRFEYKHDMEIVPGMYELTISAPGFVTRSERVEIISGADKQVRIELLKAAGGLKVSGEPVGAKVAVDGQVVGAIPYSIEHLPVGTHEVVVSHDGHKSVTNKVEIRSGQLVSLVVALAQLPQAQPRPVQSDGPIASSPGIAKSEVPASQGAEIGEEDTQDDLSLSGQPVPGKPWKDPVTGMEFVWVPAGSFMMGSNAGNADEQPVHKVIFSKGFWIGKYEVTQNQWKKVMGRNPAEFRGSMHPVEMVSWQDCQEFVEIMNSNADRYRFSLPTESQWEYAARSGGKDERYAGGNYPERYAWYHLNNTRHTHQVGTKEPNGLGIFDMSGNVWEWCLDSYGPYQIHKDGNKVALDGYRLRVIRGGNFIFNKISKKRQSGSEKYIYTSPSSDPTTTGRGRGFSNFRDCFLGLRIVLQDLK